MGFGFKNYFSWKEKNYILLSINGVMSFLYNKLGLYKFYIIIKNGLKFIGICFNGIFFIFRMVNSFVYS